MGGVGVKGVKNTPAGSPKGSPHLWHTVALLGLPTCCITHLHPAGAFRVAPVRPFFPVGQDMASENRLFNKYRQLTTVCFFIRVFLLKNKF